MLENFILDIKFSTLNVDCQGKKIIPKYKAFRDNQKEFGASMKAVKSFRAGLEQAESVFFDNTFATRAGKVFRTVLNRHEGERGKRPMDISVHKEVLNNFDFNSKSLLQDVFSAPCTISANAARTEVTVTFPPFAVADYVFVPEKATHFQTFCYRFYSFRI